MKQVPVNVKADEKSILFKISGENAKQLSEQFRLLRRNLLRKLGVAVQDSLLKRSKRTTSKVVGFIHTDDTTRKVVSKIATRMAAVGENPDCLSLTIRRNFQIVWIARLLFADD